jgi:hypothetical protein
MATRFHASDLVKPTGITEIEQCRSLAPWRGLGALLERFKSFLNDISVGGMHMDEHQETKILNIKNQDPTSVESMVKHSMSANIRNTVGCNLFDAPATDKKREAVFDRSPVKPSMVCEALIRMFLSGQLRMDIPDSDPSLRSREEGELLASVQMARQMYGQPEAHCFAGQRYCFHEPAECCKECCAD